MVKKKKKFNDVPFAYHQEIELEISTLTNLGSGLGRIALPDAPPPAQNPESPVQTPAQSETTPASSSVPDQADAPPATSVSASNTGWVVMVPFTLPGERVRARVFRNHKNFSEADLVTVLTPSPHRTTPGCPLFGRCGGCQYQHLTYSEQLKWKQQQVAELLQHLAGIEFPVSPVVPSPRDYGYRSKITPHFAAPRRFLREAPGSAFRVSTSESQEQSVPGAVSSTQHPKPETHNQEPGTKPAELESRNPELGTSNSELGTRNRDGAAVVDFPIGFLRQGTRFDIVDVPRCPIATDAINERLTEVRARVHANRDTYTRGATLLLRDASGTVTTDYDAIVTETIALSSTPADASANTQHATLNAQFSADPRLRLHFLARDFFQNNPFILPAFTRYVREQAAASGARFLVDAYCGSGLFALSAASAFERVAGVEISESSVRFARENATANGITNTTFLAADAAAIFAGLTFPAADSVVVIDPPRKGCDRAFLQQLFAYGPRAVVYVSCDPATQMRDLREFLTAGYELTAAQPFDLFPQTRHLECVLTLRRTSIKI